MLLLFGAYLCGLEVSSYITEMTSKLIDDIAMGDLGNQEQTEILDNETSEITIIYIK